jgi:hypothetical protein
MIHILKGLYKETEFLENTARSKIKIMWRITPNSFQRWAPALFSRFRAREREVIKERESAKKEEREKSESAERERKSANMRFFLPPQWKSGFRAQSRSAGGKQGF